MVRKPSSKKARQKRHYRIRRRLSGTTQRPRLCVFRSGKHIYAQIIDDTLGVTLAAASTLDKDFDKTLKGKEAAKQVGLAIAKKASEKSIAEVLFDRSGYLYHGRVQELAEGAREGGLKF